MLKPDPPAVRGPELRGAEVIVRPAAPVSELRLCEKLVGLKCTTLGPTYQVGACV